MSDKLETKVRVRLARVSDREAVFRFCRKTWGWGDYVPRVWDRWLKDRGGRVFVAAIEGLPVGICHLSLDKPREVWLSAARTDPEYRRMGIATAITEKCLEYARRKGAKKARLMTESFNVAAQALLPKLGFVRVAEFAETEARKMTAQVSRGSRWAKADEAEALWHYLRGSKTYRKAAGLYVVMFHYFSLDKPDLKRFVMQQSAIVHEDGKGKTDGLMLIDDATKEWHENMIQTSYVDGSPEAVLDIGKFLKSHCHASGIKSILGMVPNQKPIVDTFLTLGFKEQESTNMVYEKRI
jgi:RimJ/RimL family protein N-acetyltransferase